MFADVAYDVLGKVGNNPEARYQFFRAFIELAKGTVDRASRNVQ